MPRTEGKWPHALFFALISYLRMTRSRGRSGSLFCPLPVDCTSADDIVPTSRPEPDRAFSNSVSPFSGVVLFPSEILAIVRSLCVDERIVREIHRSLYTQSVLSRLAISSVNTRASTYLALHYARSFFSFPLPLSSFTSSKPGRPKSLKFIENGMLDWARSRKRLPS